MRKALLKAKARSVLDNEPPFNPNLEQTELQLFKTCA
jgi:hypothetical protein